MTKKDSADYKKWRKQVYERDKWTCQKCGQKNIPINAHHILSWENYPEKRYDVDNGITLCTDCHVLLHKIKGYHSLEKIMFEECRSKK